MVKGKLYFTIGMPRSGKSTFCNSWINNRPEASGSTFGNPRVIVSSDDIRMALHGRRYSKFAETMVFAIKHVMIRAHLARGFDVIVDGTHSTKISIQRLLEIDRSAVAVRVDTPAEECIKRAITTNQSDLIGPIKRIDRNLKKIDEIGLQNFMVQIVEEIDERGLFTPDVIDTEY